MIFLSSEDVVLVKAKEGMLLKMKKRLLIITQDEKPQNKNKDLFDNSLAFCKNLAGYHDIEYFQLTNLQYTDGLVSQMIQKYTNNSKKNVTGIITAPQNYDTLKKFSSSMITHVPAQQIEHHIPGTKISYTSQTSSTTTTQFHMKKLFNDNYINYFLSNFNYIILHHGGEEIIHYFSALNHHLLQDENDSLQTTDNSFPLEKLVLVNTNATFNNMINQYNLLMSSTIGKNSLSHKFSEIQDIQDFWDLIQEVKIYTPRQNKQFTIDD